MKNRIFLNIIIIFIFTIIIAPSYLFNPINLHFQGDFVRVVNLLGEGFYMRDSLSWPIFSIKSMSYPPGTNLVYTDSLPLFGFLSKLISIIINKNFFYSPLYQLLSWYLNGILSYFIFYKYTKDFNSSLLVGIFFLLIPFHIIRFDFFVSLTSHFLILMCFYIFFERSKKNEFLKYLIIFISLGTHFYIFSMCILVIMTRILINNQTIKKMIIEFTYIILFSLFFMYLYGYFLTGSPGAFDNYGIFSTNIISLINPPLESLSGSVVGSFNIMSGQYEGFAWLGLGGVILLIFVILNYKKYLKKNNIFLLSSIFLILLFSLSNKVYFGNILLIEFPIPSFFENFLNIWQSSGRFIWIIAYIILISGFYYIHINYDKYLNFNLKVIYINKIFHIKYSTIIFGIILFIQFLDIYPFINKKFAYPKPIQIISEGLENHLENLDTEHFQADFWDPKIAYSAYVLGKTTNIGYDARPLKKDENFSKYPSSTHYIEFISNASTYLDKFNDEMCIFKNNYNGSNNYWAYINHKSNSKKIGKCFIFDSSLFDIDMNMDLNQFDNLNYFNISISNKNSLSNKEYKFEIKSNLEFKKIKGEKYLLNYPSCNSKLIINLNKDSYVINFLNYDFINFNGFTKEIVPRLKSNGINHIFAFDKNCKKLLSRINFYNDN